jgi:type IV secretion/conjugal transfer VirB4 family ATPase
MENETLQLLSNGNVLLRTSALVLSCAAAAGVASTFIPTVMDRLLPPPRQDRLGDFLMFDHMVDNAVIAMKDKRYAAVISIRGAELTLCRDEDHDDLWLRRKHLFDEIHKKTQVEQINIFQAKERAPIRQEARHSNKLLRAVAEKWNDNFAHSYQLKHYMLVIIKAPNDEEAIERMDDATRFIIDTLSDYKCSLMRQSDEEGHDGPLAALAAIISPVTRPKPRTSGWHDNISHLLTADQVSFREEKKGVISFKGGSQTKYAIIVNIRDCGERSSEAVMRDLLALDGEILVYHSIQPRNTARELLTLGREAKSSPFMNLSITAGEEYLEVTRMLEGQSDNKAALLNYSMHVIIYGATLKECSQLESQVNSILARTGGTPVRERGAAQAVWFSMFNYDKFWPRMYRLLSPNLASSVYFQRMNAGMMKSDWLNEPLTYFKTMEGGAYSFQLHATDERQAPGHAVLIGPTGRGKTTFVSFLAAQAMRIPNLRTFFFDRHLGLKVFTECVGGKYVTFDGQSAATMNPLHLPDSPENRAFLFRFLKMLSGLSTARAEQEIARAVKVVYEMNMPREKRRLRDIQSTSFSVDGGVRANLQRWIDPTQYGSYFNAAEDTLDLQENRMISFDMTTILREDPAISTPAMDYITHRLRMLSKETGDPALIFIDETEPMLANKDFAMNFVKVGLQEGRKARQAYILAFQRPEAIKQAGMSELIRGQCQTGIFLRNPMASPDDYSEWDLNPAEFAFICGKEYAERPYSILVKKYATGESVVLDINMSSLGRYFNAFQSGNTDIRLLKQAQEKHGENFLEHYLDAVR